MPHWNNERVPRPNWPDVEKGNGQIATQEDRITRKIGDDLTERTCSHGDARSDYCVSGPRKGSTRSGQRDRWN